MGALWKHVVPADELRGDDEEDTALLRASLEEATAYLRGFEWCRGIREFYFGAGVGGIVAVFLFRIEPAPGVDQWLWVVVGDLPSAYLVTDRAPDPTAALRRYCELMGDWVASVRAGKGLEAVYPVAAPATLEHAAMLEGRLELLRSTVIPNLE